MRLERGNRFILVVDFLFKQLDGIPLIIDSQKETIATQKETIATLQREVDMLRQEIERLRSSEFSLVVADNTEPDK